MFTLLRVHSYHGQHSFLEKLISDSEIKLIVATIKICLLHCYRCGGLWGAVSWSPDITGIFPPVKSLLTALHYCRVVVLDVGSSV